MHDNAGEDSKSLVEGDLYSSEVSVFSTVFVPVKPFLCGYIKLNRPFFYQN